MMQSRITATGAATALCLMVLSGLLESRQRPSFSSKVDAVRLDVLVTRAGRPIEGLTKNDFEVLDEGARQQIELVSLEHLPLNVVLALDTSESVTGVALRHLQEASDQLLRTLGDQDQAALVTFNHAIRLSAPLTLDRLTLRNAIGRITPGGGTALRDATYASIVVGEQAPARTLAVVFTDGEDTGSYLSSGSLVEVAKRTNVVVYLVTLGGQRPAKALRAVADNTGGAIVAARSSDQLRSTFIGILDEFRHRYLLGYTPKGDRRTGWHKVEVRVSDRSLKVSTRAGYSVD